MDGPTPWRTLESGAAPEPPPADASAARQPSVRAAAAAACILVLGLIVATGLLLLRLDRLSGPDAARPAAADEAIVEIAGAVLRPGLYHVPTGSRVADAIAAAGGYSPRIDVARAERQVDLTAEVVDGDRIVVPARDAMVAQPPGETRTGAADTRRVDLNRATQGELEALPGIGPVTAKKIIDARTERPFTTASELIERKVLGRATLEKLRDMVLPAS